MATTEEKIERAEQRLRDFERVREVIGEAKYWELVNYELDYLKPLYEERRKKK